MRYGSGMTNPADAFVGQILGGRFRLEEHLADGYFSHVYRAIDTRDDVERAVKLLQPSAASSSSAVIEFEAEARLMGILNPCANVADLEHSGDSTLTVELNGVSTPVVVSFHVMELADADLSKLLAFRHELPWSMRLRLFRQLVAGVHQMHLKGVVHRDLKSSNSLLFDTDTMEPIAKISDLGRSCSTAAAPRFSIDEYRVGRGDLSFAPPELIWLQGSTDPISYRRSDVYLLGSLLFEMATGQGITGMAIPDWRAEAQKAASVPEVERAKVFAAKAKSMQADFELPLGVFASELPVEIRDLGSSLVRQMCNPRPERREWRFRVERKNPPWGLQWVFRRVDIMIRNLHLAGVRAHGSQRKAG